MSKGDSTSVSVSGYEVDDKRRCGDITEELEEVLGQPLVVGDAQVHKVRRVAFGLQRVEDFLHAFVEAMHSHPVAYAQHATTEGTERY